MTGVGA